MAVLLLYLIVLILPWTAPESETRACIGSKEALLDFPDILFRTNRELQIFLGDGIIVLINHHDS